MVMKTYIFSQMTSLIQDIFSTQEKAEPGVGGEEG